MSRREKARSRFSPSQVAYVERHLAHVEERRCQPFGEADLAEALSAFASPDGVVRAKAIQQICPCRVPWEVFGHLRKVAKRVQQDPSPLVRANARHVEEDAREILALEALLERVQEAEEETRDPRRLHRRTQRHRSRAKPA